ncbi:MAG: hypothetical protein Q4A92_08075 [Corynebacterium sp.]|nr:hypothetical protein [Corynebacterium sp.]
MRTTPIAALIAFLINIDSATPVALLDADTVNQPLRPLLNTPNGGDLIGLTNHKTKGLNRQEIESYAITHSPIPLLTAAPTNTTEFSAHSLETAIHRSQHRWPTIIINLPYTCSKETITAGLELSTHSFHVAPPKPTRYSWPHVHNPALDEKLASNQATVLLTSKNSGIDGPNTLYLPYAEHYFSLQGPLEVLRDPHSLTQFRRILSRVYPRTTAFA